VRRAGPNSRQGTVGTGGDLLSSITWYFAALRTQIRTGRDFEPTDGGRALEPATAIVNEHLREYFGSSNVLGREFRYLYGNSRVRLTIVGVVADNDYYDCGRLPTRSSIFPQKAAIRLRYTPGLRSTWDRLCVPWRSKHTRSARDSHP
jgi:hypothetical protein